MTATGLTIFRSRNPLCSFLVASTNGYRSHRPALEPNTSIVEVALGLLMNDRRSALRMRMLKSADIILTDKAPKIECAVRSISASGVCRLQRATACGNRDLRRSDSY
jgi:hypothetical protein